MHTHTSMRIHTYIVNGCVGQDPLRHHCSAIREHSLNGCSVFDVREHINEPLKHSRPLGKPCRIKEDKISKATNLTRCSRCSRIISCMRVAPCEIPATKPHTRQGNNAYAPLHTFKKTLFGVYRLNSSL